MKHLSILLTSLVLFLGLGYAQEGTETPPTTTPETAPVQPTVPAEETVPATAMIRIIHLAPNAPSVSISLIPAEEVAEDAAAGEGAVEGAVDETADTAADVATEAAQETEEAVGEATDEATDAATAETTGEEAAGEEGATTEDAGTEESAGEEGLATTAEGDMVELSPQGIEGLSYTDTSGFVEIPAGEYVVTVSAEGAQAFEQTISFDANQYYTLAVTGLVLPPEDAQPEEGEEGGGFFDWIANLFTGEDPDARDVLALQLRVYEDDLERSLDEGVVALRAVHASPGTEEIDVALAEERGSVINNVEYGEASGYVNLNLQEEGGDLEVRIAGSQATALELADLTLQPGTLTTIYVAGTALESAPLQAVILTDPVQTGAGAGVADTMPPTTPAPGAAAPPVDAEIETAEPTTTETPATEEAAAEPATEEAQEEAAAEEPATEGASQETTEATQETEEEAAATPVDPSDSASQTIIDVAMADENLSTFAELVQQAGLAETLAADGSYTVFAPSNEAFAAIPQGELEALMSDPAALSDLLSYHVVEGVIPSEDLMNSEAVTTLQGGELTLSTADGSVTVNGATVVAADIEAANGVIHVIDTVLMPGAETGDADGN